MKATTPPNFSRDRDAPLRVVVLTCAGMGLETAAALENLPGIEVLAVVNSPHRQLPFRRKIRKIWRARGAIGLLGIAAGKLKQAATRPSARRPAGAMPRCSVIEVADLHSEESLAQLHRLAPDLAVVDGTYLLKPTLFDLPRFGSINLHCGKVPEYRGSPPAFWELYDGTDQVGVTVHLVTENLDEGPVLLERSFPIDTAPGVDPVRYIEDYWRRVLRPNGIDMLKQVVAAIGDGSARPTPQAAAGSTRRTPTRQETRELRRRVNARRRNR